jgi:hypothetical protein
MGSRLPLRDQNSFLGIRTAHFKLGRIQENLTPPRLNHGFFSPGVSGEMRIDQLNSSVFFGVRGLVLAFLGAWLLLSIWNQFLLLKANAKRGRSYRGFQWDVWGMIPVWCLWTDPPSWDSVLLYRNKLTDGRLTPWKNAWAVSANPFRGIWSPQSRKCRAIHAWLPLLTTVAEGERQPRESFLSWQYVSAALYVSGLQPHDSIEYRQFMVARVSGFDREQPAEILFVSPLFRLESAL